MPEKWPIRTIRNGRIKWNHRWWKPRGDVSHIEGHRLAFGTYAPEFNLLALMGTVEMLNHPDLEEGRGRELWNEYCQMMGTGETRKFPEGMDGGSCVGNVDGDTIYIGRDIYFWKPIEGIKQ